MCQAHMSSSVAVCTIVAKNYLPFARVLMSSLKQANPDFRRFVILADDVNGYFEPAAEDFELIFSEDIGIPKSKWFHFKYTILELSTAVKPYVLEHLLTRYNLSKVIYLDPDIRIYRSLDGLARGLDSANMLLTPHLTAPLDSGNHPDDLDILRSGSYNLGFIALTGAPEMRRFLAWWQEKLYDHCVVDLPRGFVCRSTLDGYGAVAVCGRRDSKRAGL